MHTPWASSRLAALLCEVQVSLGEVVVSARVGGEDVKGDAQITMMRGKRKHIYDYTITGTLDVQVLGSESAGGSFNLGDVTADLESEVEVRLPLLTGVDVGQARRVVETALRAALKQFDDEFKAK